MIGYTITGYDVSRIVFTSPDTVDTLPTNVRDGSIAILQAENEGTVTETPYVFWKGDWVEITTN